MNILKDAAGFVTHAHILSRGFEVFETIEGCDMGQIHYSMPQFDNGTIKILGGYWNYKIKDKADNILFDGWWNSNEEFDETINMLMSK